MSFAEIRVPESDPASGPTGLCGWMPCIDGTPAFGVPPGSPPVDMPVAPHDKIDPQGQKRHAVAVVRVAEDAQRLKLSPEPLDGRPGGQATGIQPGTLTFIAAHVR
ncbi:hypothetical protein AB0J28_32050 [Streptosporangium canum]|uniref:hypothetical protein n=1 Tax=Streptosporangium canum TaxID=324952 RepID=UPI003416B181